MLNIIRCIRTRNAPFREVPSNPVSNLLNRSLFSGSGLRTLHLWERVLLRMGF